MTSFELSELSRLLDREDAPIVDVLCMLISDTRACTSHGGPSLARTCPI